jgi:flavodoxin
MNKSLLFIAAASMCIVFSACHSGAQKTDASPSENSAPAAEAPAAAAPGESAPQAEAPKAEEAPAAEAAQNAPNDEKAAVPSAETEVLVAYFSYSGNTRYVAEYIQKKTNADIFEIKAKVPYPAEYDACVAQAKQELEGKAFPEIESTTDVGKYKTIYIGFPNWWGSLPRPVMTFLKPLDLSDKSIRPFLTHGSGGVQQTEADLKAAVKAAEFKPILSIRDKDVKSEETQKAIDAWIAN